MSIEKVRALCLELPGATEVHVDAWGHPTFRIRDKIFATWGSDGGVAYLGVKTTKPHQAELVKDPRFAIAAYVGRHGWVSMRLDEPVDWELVRTLIVGSFKLIAPKGVARHVAG